MRRLTEVEKLEIVDIYLNHKKSCGQIAKQFGITRGGIYNILKVKKVVLRKRKNYFNLNYFDNIDTEEKAYWLGFIVADGNVYHNTISIQLCVIDEKHLIKFANSVGLSYNRDFDKKKNAVRVRLNSKYMASKLSELGVVPAKSDKIIVPNISKNLLRHFFRGFIDGDGSLYKTKNKKGANNPLIKRRNRKSKFEKFVTLKLSAGSDCKYFLRAFKNWICDTLGESFGYIYTKFYQGKNRYKLTFTGNISATKVANILYKDANIFLDRKYQLYEKYYKNY